MKAHVNKDSAQEFRFDEEYGISNNLVGAYIIYLLQLHSIIAKLTLLFIICIYNKT